MKPDKYNGMKPAGRTFVIRFSIILVATLFAVLILVAVAIALAKSGSGLFHDFLAPRTVAVPTPSQSRELTNTYPALIERWRLKELYIPPLPSMSPIIHVDSALFYFEGVPPLLSSVDTESGLIRWQVPLEQPVFELASQDSRILLISDWQIKAYSNRTGEVIWEGQELQGHATHELRMTESGLVKLLSIDDTGGVWKQVIRTYDPATGTISSLEERAAETGAKLVIMRDDIEIWTVHKGLFAIDPATGREIWRRDVERRVWDLLLLPDYSLVILSGGPPTMQAVSAKDGTFLWSSPHLIVSNIGVFNGDPVAITSTGALVAFGSKDGHVVELAQFEPQMIERSGRSVVYSLLGTDNMIFLYFGDSQELIALEVTSSFTQGQ